MNSFLSTLRPTVLTLFLFTLLLGGAYPGLVTLINGFAFPQQSGGSLIHDANGKVLGSRLIGQNFDKPQYLWGRLSATSPGPYNGAGSSGSNFGVNNPALLDAVKGRIKALHAADPSNSAPIPVDLVTASASGLDPEISPAAADYQVARIATARHVNAEVVRTAITQSTRERSFGILGEARVNVLEVNLRLDGKLK